MFSNKQSLDKTHIAKVTNTNDPERRGRIKVTCVALLGDEFSELPGWIVPALSWGWFVIPDVGQYVTVSFTSGSDADTFKDQSSITGSQMQWHGSTHFTDDNVTPATPVPGEFVEKNYGKRRGFKTPRGHVLLFDDSAGDEQIQLTWSGGKKSDPKTAFFAFDSDGSFMAQDAGGGLFYMNGSDNEMSLIQAAGNRISLTNDGISMVDVNGNAFTMGTGGISFVSSGPMVFQGADHMFYNGLHFAGLDQIPVNVGGLCSMFHPLTVQGLEFINDSSMFVPPWTPYYLLFNETAVL